MKNIVLLPYKSKPKDWGNWSIKSPNTTNTVVDPKESIEQDAAKTDYVPHSPYYSPVHSLQFYEDE